MPVRLRQLDSGVEILVKASPGSRKNELRGVVDGALKVCVTTVAEKGKANTAIIKLLARELGVPKSRLELTSGATSSLKKFVVLGAQLSVLEQRLAQRLAD
jgi:uncharacterized protein YggU (UPF0235/DUF167 family)